MATINKEPRIYNKSGELSAYGYSCGYITKKVKVANPHIYLNPKFSEEEVILLKKELYMEHGVYHVRQFHNATRILWESFYTLTEAKKLYSSIIL